MIRIIDEVPANMVAFEASGNIDESDFDIVKSRVDRLVDRTGKLNYLLLLDTELSQFSMGAWLQDAWLGLKHLSKWNRAAIVTSSENISRFTDFFSKVMPGEFRGFPKEELPHAIDWVSGKTI